MPKPLSTCPPSSAIARFLDGNTALRTLAPPQEPPIAIEPFRPKPTVTAVTRATATGEPANIKRELVLTRSADQTLTALVTLFRNQTGAKLTHSHVARAILRLLSQRMHAVQHQAERMPPLRLPSNARGCEAERDQFEQAITNVLAAACSIPPP